MYVCTVYIYTRWKHGAFVIPWLCPGETAEQKLERALEKSRKALGRLG